MYIRNVAKNWKIFVAFYIIAFDLVASNSRYYEENICDRQSMC